jgi:hypothetical protein
MDPPSRKLVHQLASTYGLKSGSQGSGKRRFTVVERTRHTQPPQGENVFKRLQVGRQIFLRNSSPRSK